MSVPNAHQVLYGERPLLPQEKESPTEVGMLELTLSENGMIRDCSKACGKCLGCPPGDLLWRHISVLLPQLAGIPLMLGGQINPRLRFLSHIGRQFEFVGISGARFLSEVFLNDIESLGRHYLHLVIRPVRNLAGTPT
jgi:hypothetical protein